MGANENEYISFAIANGYSKFVDVYPDYDISRLPIWVQKDIENAYVYGAGQKCILMPDGQKYHMDNSLNDMNGRDWTLFINSVFTTHYPTKGKEGYAHEIRKIHPSPKPPQLMWDLINFFTKRGELVFDSFMGVGGTLLGAALADRDAIGIDLNQKYIDAYRAAAEKLGLKQFPAINGDCLEIVKDDEVMRSVLGNQEISLLLIDPPYSNMMSKEKTGASMVANGNADATPFTDSKKDLGNMEKDRFLESLRQSVEYTLPYIKKRGYVIIFIKDLQPHKKEINFLHADVVSEINKIPNVYYKGMKIWADTGAKLYPYGYPFCFVANQIHQYILIFRKEK